MENKVKKIVEFIKKDSFVPGYEASDEEGLGLLISHFCDWDGLKILEATYEALEDANFHTENETILELINNIKHQTQLK